MDIKGSQTEKNLLAAFTGESMARNKYLFLLKKLAKKEMMKLLIYLNAWLKMKAYMEKCSLNV